jgi:hypothetical protein
VHLLMSLDEGRVYGLGLRVWTKEVGEKWGGDTGICKQTANICSGMWGHY